MCVIYVQHIHNHTHNHTQPPPPPPPKQALSRLLFEERTIRFKTTDDEQLWCFFMRRSGMHKVDFLEVLKRGSYRRIAKGDTIYDVERDDITLYLMIEVRMGCVW